MKREKWNQKTDLRNDPAESVSGAYEKEREYTLEEILSEFSGDWNSDAGEQTEWDDEALMMSELEPYLLDGYEAVERPAAQRTPDRTDTPAVQINEEESQITAEAVAPEAQPTPENTADPAQAVSENSNPDSLRSKPYLKTAIPTLSGVKRVQRLRKPRSPEGAKKQGETKKSGRAAANGSRL